MPALRQKWCVRKLFYDKIEGLINNGYLEVAAVQEVQKMLDEHPHVDKKPGWEKLRKQFQAEKKANNKEGTEETEEGTEEIDEVLLV